MAFVSHWPVSPRATWGLLFAAFTVDDLSALLTAVQEHGLPEWCSWKCRHLVDPATASALAKKRLIDQTILRGRVMLLQETHWTTADAKVWQADLQATYVASSSSPPSAPPGEGGPFRAGWGCHMTPPRTRASGIA